MRVRLVAGPGDGQVVELNQPFDEELTIEVRRAASFRLTESWPEARAVESEHEYKAAELHCYRRIRQDPPLMEWAGPVEE